MNQKEENVHQEIMRSTWGTNMKTQMDLNHSFSTLKLDMDYLLLKTSRKEYKGETISEQEAGRREYIQVTTATNFSSSMSLKQCVLQAIMAE